MSFAAAASTRNVIASTTRASLRNTSSTFRVASLRRLNSSHVGRPPKSDKPWIVASVLIFGPAFLYLVSSTSKDTHFAHNDKHDSSHQRHVEKPVPEPKPELEPLDENTAVDATEVETVEKKTDTALNGSSTRPMREQVEEYIVSLQDQIVSTLESLDPAAPRFKRDSWLRSQGGRGQSCVFSAQSDKTSTANETVLEKAGVNISVVHGMLPPAAIQQMRADHTSMPLPDRPEGLPFFAAGISLVIHPRNPNAPTVHANYRYFEITESQTDASGGAEPKVLAWWFGGGCDLTPSYLFEEDAVHFHSTLKDTCDRHGSALYPNFKKWCDEYFYIPHRQETRGVGGIFFDDLNEGPHARLPHSDAAGTSSRPSSPTDIFNFVKDIGNSFIPSYIPILNNRNSLPYTELQRRWQLLRRGRYVEFNLVYDRGTKFGLVTPGARIESILMSLPETARWEYMSELGEQGTEEGKVIEVLKNPREWV